MTLLLNNALEGESHNNKHPQTQTVRYGRQILISETSYIQNIILNEIRYLYRHKGIEEKKQWNLNQNIRYLGGY